MLLSAEAFNIIAKCSKNINGMHEKEVTIINGDLHMKRAGPRMNHEWCPTLLRFGRNLA